MFAWNRKHPRHVESHRMAEIVSIKPELIPWAVDRSQLPVEDLAREFPRLEEWRAVSPNRGAIQQPRARHAWILNPQDTVREP